MATVHMHLVKVTCIYALHSSNTVSKIFSFFPLPSLSLLCSSAHCLTKLYCHSRHKDYEVITYSQTQMWKVEIQHYELTRPQEEVYRHLEAV